MKVVGEILKPFDVRIMRIAGLWCIFCNRQSYRPRKSLRKVLYFINEYQSIIIKYNNTIHCY